MKLANVSIVPPGSELLAQTVENLPATQETQVSYLRQEDTQEKGMATHCSILPGELYEQRSLAGYSPCCCC